MPSPEPLELALVRGSLHIPVQVYETWFAGVEACILLRDGPDLCVLPVRHLAGGGHLLKIRNSRGDRAVAATDFFRNNRVDDYDRRIPVEWSSRIHGLVSSGFFEVV